VKAFSPQKRKERKENSEIYLRFKPQVNHRDAEVTEREFLPAAFRPAQDESRSVYSVILRLVSVLSRLHALAALGCMGLVLCATSLGGRGVAYAWQVCETAEDVRFCVEMKGACELYHLLPKEKGRMRMDLLHVSIMNKSDRWVKIVPEAFYGVTTGGQVIAMDPAFYQSIELKTKLARSELRPWEKLDGFLFFPTSFGLVRTLVYGGEPYIEILLY
jgi:hypothetical protein